MRDDIENAAVVLFGNTFYVVVNTTGRTITKDAAEACAVERFTFEGRCVKSNAAAVEAMKLAKRACRRVVR